MSEGEIGKTIIEDKKDSKNPLRLSHPGVTTGVLTHRNCSSASMSVTKGQRFG